MCRVSPTAFFFVLLGTCLWAQPARQVLLPTDPRPSMPPRIRELVDLASALPPELASTVLIRISGASEVTDQDERIDLVERAFVAAGRAQYPLQVRNVAIRPPFPTRGILLASALRLRVDRVSLQSRAVQRMISLDPLRAREMFGSIHLDVPRGACSSDTVPEPKQYFETASALLRGAFSGDDREVRERNLIARAIVGRLSSPVELAPAALMISSLDAPAAERSDLIYAFALAMEKMAGDDSSFSATLNAVSDAIQKNLAPLAGGAAKVVLEKSFRLYLVRNFSGTRCAQNAAVPFPAQMDALHFTEEEASPAKVEPATAPEPVFAHFGEIMARVEKLFPGETYANRGKVTTQLEKNDWLAAFKEWMDYLNAMSPGPSQTDGELQIEKLYCLSSVLGVVPQEIDKGPVLRQYFGVLTQSPLHDESWAQWYDRALTFAKSGPAAMRMMEESGSRDAAVIAKMEAITPEQP